MNRPLIIGIMGGSAASEAAMEQARQLGRLVAGQGWILLNGGRNSGIMNASAQGAAEEGGITLGIVPDADIANTSMHIQIPVITGMGSARNVINVLTSHVVVACPGGAGTVSEIALALKHGKPVILFGCEMGNLFSSSRPDMVQGRLYSADSAEEVIERILRMKINVS